ncbi:STAS domain protein [Leptospira kirschneri serovar Cynopteri str. 3522 CT]|nr:STAS domain protein [Leptospira kirschneri serovar Cynopteri str. 3522 CT]
MEIKTKKIGKHTLVALNGRLDIGHSDEVEAKLLDDVQSGQGDILINLENISYISSSGIRIFVGMVRELEKQGRKLKLCCITPPVKKYLMWSNCWICSKFTKQKVPLSIRLPKIRVCPGFSPWVLCPVFFPPRQSFGLFWLF